MSSVELRLSTGNRGFLFVLPLIALGSYTLMAAIPILGTVKPAKILESANTESWLSHE